MIPGGMTVRTSSRRDCVSRIDALRGRVCPAAFVAAFNRAALGVW